MVCFFLSLLKRKLPQRCPKQGGVKATFGQCPKGSSFFFRITSLRPMLWAIDRLTDGFTCRATATTKFRSIQHFTQLNYNKHPTLVLDFHLPGDKLLLLQLLDMLLHTSQVRHTSGTMCGKAEAFPHIFILSSSRTSKEGFLFQWCP